MTKYIYRLLIITLLAILNISCGGSSDDNVSDPTVTTFSELNTDIFTGDTYQASEISQDSNGDNIVRTKLAILFKPLATKAEVDVLLASINATITASITGARSVSIRIPDPITVDALEIIISDIESETFVEAVLKSVVNEPTVLPDNLDVSAAGDVEYIEHHAAVRGTAAWNAKEAISNEPDIILMDFLGAGSSPLTSHLDASLSGNVGITAPDDHGYHVAGIITGSFGGSSTIGGGVTGMFPGSSNLSIIDLTNGISSFDAKVLAVTRAAAFGGTVVMNTSLGLSCQSSTTSNTCREKSVAMQDGIMWADMVRAAGVETRLFHTKSAGNRRSPAPDMRDTQTNHAFATAATMTDMVTADGTPVLPLTNTMVVERLDSIGNPIKVYCLNNNSFIGGHISAIGTDVISLDQSGSGVRMSGTSMAAPQVAGLAAYMLAIDDTLTPQRIKDILLDTSQAVGMGIDFACSDWSQPAPAIDAYAAVLSLDKESALSGSRSEAPVRNAILDVSNNGTDIASNGQFNEFDLMYYLQEIDTGSQDKRDGTYEVKYSRVDLNGDGYDGGGNDYTKKFNLNINYPPTFTTVTQIIEGEEAKFDETSLSDEQILCYYAYSDLYTGSESERTNLMGSRCKPSIVAVYYYHFNDINFPGSNSSCGNTDEDVNDERETFSIRPDFTEELPERPDSHFWKAGDSSVDQTLIETTTLRSEDDPSGDINNCIRQQDYYASSDLDSTLAISDTDNIFNIDIAATSASECWNMDPDTPEWECSNATTRTGWIAEYDFEISAATSLNLNLNFQCTGANMALPTILGMPELPPTDITYTVMRFDAAGNLLPMNRDPEKMVVAEFFDCNDDFPDLNIQQLMEFDAPEIAGDVDRIIIMLTGGAGAFGHMGNTFYLVDPTLPQPNEGGQTNTTTMLGTVQLVPAE